MGTWNELIDDLGGAGAVWNDAGTDTWEDHIDKVTKMQVTRFTTNTSTGTQDITITDFGTPQIAMFFFNGENSTADGVTSHAIIGMGATDGTTQWALAMSEEDGVGNNDGGKNQRIDRVVNILDENTGVPAKASFDSWITDGIRINWDANTLSTGVLVTCVLIGGATNAYTYYKKWGYVVNQTVDITDPGFEPDFVLFGCIGTPYLNNTADYGMFSFGFGINDNDVTQKCIAYGTANNAAISGYGMQVFSNRVASQTINTGTSWAAELSDFDANGFSLTSRLGSGGGDWIFYIAIKTEKAVWSGSIDSPTSTGNHAVTGTKLDPDFVFMMESMVQTEDTFISTGDAGGFAITAFDDTNEYCHGIATEDDVTVTNTESGLDNIAVYYNKDDGTAAFDATHVSMDEGGWTLNYSTVDGTTRKWIAFAIGTAVAGEPIILIAQHHYKMLSNQ